MTVKQLKDYLAGLPDNMNIEVTFLKIDTIQQDYGGDDFALYKEPVDYDVFGKLMIYPEPGINTLIVRGVLD